MLLPRPTLVALFFVPASAQTHDWSVLGNFADHSFGRTSAIVGDVDGDGFDDVYIGEEDGSPVIFHDGQARIFSGATGAVIHTLDGGTALIGIGHDGAGLGDLDGDGRDDFAVAFIDRSPIVYSGVDASILHEVSSSVGTSSSLAGRLDLNGDGYRDLVVGATGNQARVSVVSGAFMALGTGSEILLAIPGGAFSFGSAVDVAEDMNGDAHPDVIVGAPSEQGADFIGAYYGVVHVFSGVNGSQIREHRRYENAYTAYGASVADAGDLNLDGQSELLVGSRFSDENGTSSGSVRIYDGATGVQIRQHLGLHAGDSFGVDVVRAGDVSGDGYPDYFVGALGDSTGGGGNGTAWLYSGWNGTPVAILGMNGGSFGTSIAAGADFDGDAYPDFVVCASNEGATGAAHAYHGSCVGGAFHTCSGAPNSYSPGGGSITSTGSYSLSSGTMTLLARNVPPGQFGVFFYGVTSAYTPYGDGFVCSAGGHYRLLPSVQIDALGMAALNVDFSAPPIGAGPGMIQGGDTRFFQFWFRDPFGPGGTGFNYTAGRAIVFCP